MPVDTMIYATFSEFTSRYATKLSESEVTSHVLPYAAARLEGLLGGHFTTPFSSNNLTARDLTLELAYLLILQRSREPGDREDFQRKIAERIAALAEGREAMITTSGDALFADRSHAVVWSNTGRYKTVFDLRGAERQEVDPQRLTEEEQG